MAVLKKYQLLNKTRKQRIFVIKKFSGVLVHKFLKWLALDFAYKICNISLDFITDKCIESFKKLFWVF